MKRLFSCFTGKESSDRPIAKNVQKKKDGSEDFKPIEGLKDVEDTKEKSKERTSLEDTSKGLLDLVDRGGLEDVYEPEEVWIKLDELISRGKCSHPKSQPQSSHGWKTIRVFISSTFKDFYHEREVLVNQVIPDLRLWCNERKLHLVECDLRWGIPDGTNEQETLELCLEEIERCYIENGSPFFINLTCRRIGGIPKQRSDENPNGIEVAIIKKYGLLFGLSITEMEIVFGAYQSKNPNALFLQRDENFLSSFPKSLPEAELKAFDYDTDIAKNKIKILKEHINKKFSEFQPSRIIEYPAAYDDKYKEGNKVKLKIPDSSRFEEQIIDFMKLRIDYTYPESRNDKPLEKFEEQRLSHEAFVDAKIQNMFTSEGAEKNDISILGRTVIIEKLMKYVKGTKNGVSNTKVVPLVLVGDAGIGKTHLMAKIVSDTRRFIQDQAKDRQLFYHFIGAVPQSTEVCIMLQRLLKELTNCEEKDIPNDIESLIQTTHSALANPEAKPMTIVIDALNQFNEDDYLIQEIKWLPPELGKHIRCLLSVVPDTPEHNKLMRREPKPNSEELLPLVAEIREEIVEKLFHRYQKKLSDDQMIKLLQKTNSENPLWLILACEELRVHGNFRTVNQKIENLNDGLIELLEQVLERFETGNLDTRDLIKGTLCCIECSKRGLLETELIDILFGEKKLQNGKKSEKELKENYSSGKRLSSYKWSNVRRVLKPFLRPYGDLSEGRLDFYHRSMSKAVRKRYLQADRESKVWHEVLVLYYKHSKFANDGRRIERKVEEYPYHLQKCGDKNGLENFLCNWETVDVLYNEDHSYTILDYWKYCGGAEKWPEKMYKKYKVMIDEEEKTKDTNQVVKRCEQVGRLLLQAAQLDKAKEIGEKALKLMKDTGEHKQLRNLGLYRLMSEIYEQKYKLHHARSPELLPIIEKALEYSQFSIEILQDMQNDDQANLHPYGKQLIKHAYIHSMLAENGGNEEMPKEIARQQGLAFAAEAHDIFAENEVHKGHLAEAVMTIGHLHRNLNFEIQYEELLRAKKLCQEAYGDSHILMGRILKNIGIALEEHERSKLCSGHLKDYIPAYEEFKEVHKLYYTLFGPDHKKTKAALCDVESDPYKTLFNDGKYKFKY